MGYGATHKKMGTFPVLDWSIVKRGVFPERTGPAEPDPVGARWNQKGWVRTVSGSEGESPAWGARP